MEFKQVPLVIHVRGETIQLGMVSVFDDGRLEGVVARDKLVWTKQILGKYLTNVSLNPAPPKPPDLKYQEVSIKLGEPHG